LILTLGFIIFTFIGFDAYQTGGWSPSVAFGEARIYSGLLLILLSIYVALLQVSFFYNKLYYRGISVIQNEELEDTRGLTFEVAKVLSAMEDDLTAAFIASPYGKEILMRAGVAPRDLEIFISSKRANLYGTNVSLSDERYLHLNDIGHHIFSHDSAFKDFLFRQGVTEEIYRGTLEWISRVRNTAKYNERWWSRDNLGKIEGIGREFSYGVAYELKRFTRDIHTTAVLSLVSNNSAYANEIIGKIEAVLAREKASNVILVGEPGVGKMDMLIELGKRMHDGESVASITGKRLIVFDKESFAATHNTKQLFEGAFLKLMSEAEHAGNIIIVIENFASFINSLEAFDVDVADLLGIFLTSPNVQIVATADPATFHQYLETKPLLMQHFDPVIIEKPELGSTIRVLEDALVGYEHRHDVYFTFPALVRVAEAAEQYVVEGVMPDKAVDLLAEVASRAGTKRIMTIWPEFVEECVSKKTGIITGPITEDEREMLLRLEDILHQRVIGQDDAVKAIASAMRRSRAGIQDKTRPIGSFLFLGSTGVGKTETAKALADAFFGSEEKMLRFDMSEFSDADALKRLLGDGSKPGILSNELRNHPYGVVLLDEFEKALSDVHDLFLQILDEGMFADSVGRRINTRNCIIIATSNAGSDLIWELAKEGKKPSGFKDAIIDKIIRENIFKPELINRFDSVVVFETLSRKQQERVAHLMLNDLKERIHQKGYSFEIDDMLIELLVDKGFDPEFGARPMQRVSQDIIEEKIAQKIIEGNLRPGDTIHFKPGDFTL
jgi:ATP-dependent Clp protease ATP-binding subunit ClpC